MALSGFALAVSVAPAIAIGVTASNPVADCPPGYAADPISGACTLGPGSGDPAQIPGNPDLPAVDGIPCTGGNSGQCIGLQESQGGDAAPIP
jgi:hypothetical protein